MKQYFIIIYPDGRVETEKAPDETMQLKFLQETVGGYIETVPCNFSSDGILIVNEEGKLKGQEVNKKATLLAKLFEGDYISGTAVFAIAAGEYLLPLSPEQTKCFTDFFERLKA